MGTHVQVIIIMIAIAPDQAKEWARKHALFARNAPQLSNLPTISRYCRRPSFQRLAWLLEANRATCTCVSADSPKRRLYSIEFQARRRSRRDVAAKRPLKPFAFRHSNTISSPLASCSFEPTERQLKGERVRRAAGSGSGQPRARFLRAI